MAEIRGKLNGSVFSRNRGGAYVRQFVKPTNPNSTKQASGRAIFGTRSSQWRALTEAQRQSFRDAAKSYSLKNRVGDTIIPTGAQLFAAVNSAVVVEGSGISKNPVTQIDPVPKSFTELGWAAEAQAENPIKSDGSSLEFSPNPLLKVPGGNGSLKLGEFFTVWATPILSAGITSPAGKPFYPIWSAELQGGIGEEALPGFSNIWEVKNFTFFYGLNGPPVNTDRGVMFVRMTSFFLGNFYPYDHGVARVPVVPSTP